MTRWVVVLLDIQVTTGNSGSKICRNLCLREFRRKYSSHCLPCLGHAFAARRCEELKADITAKIDKKIAYGKK
jgi:hypothetical protein